MKPHLAAVLILVLAVGAVIGANVQPSLTGGGYVLFPENANPAYLYASSGLLTLAAGGTNQNIYLAPSGTGLVNAATGYATAGTAGVTSATITSANLTIKGGIVTAATSGTSGGPSTQTNYSGSGRAIGTVYQNTGTTARWVTVSVNAGSGLSSAQAITDSSSSPTTVMASTTTPTGASGIFVLSMSFVVLPNNYYKVIQYTGTVTLQNWAEWQ